MNLGLLSASIDVSNERLERAVSESLGGVLSGGDNAMTQVVAQQIREHVDKGTTLDQTALKNTLNVMGTQVGNLLQNANIVLTGMRSGISGNSADIVQLRTDFTKIQQDHKALLDIPKLDQLINSATAADKPFWTGFKTQAIDLESKMNEVFSVIGTAASIVQTKETELAQLNARFLSEKNKAAQDLARVQQDLANLKASTAANQAQAQANLRATTARLTASNGALGQTQAQINAAANTPGALATVANAGRTVAGGVSSAAGGVATAGRAVAGGVSTVAGGVSTAAGGVATAGRAVGGALSTVGGALGLVGGNPQAPATQAPATQAPATQVPTVQVPTPPTAQPPVATQAPTPPTQAPIPPTQVPTPPTQTTEQLEDANMNTHMQSTRRQWFSGHPTPVTETMELWWRKKMGFQGDELTVGHNGKKVYHTALRGDPRAWTNTNRYELKDTQETLDAAAQATIIANASTIANAAAAANADRLARADAAQPPVVAAQPPVVAAQTGPVSVTPELVRKVADYAKNWSKQTNPSRGQLAHTYGVMILKAPGGAPLVKFVEDPRNSQGLDLGKLTVDFKQRVFGVPDGNGAFIYENKSGGVLTVKVGDTEHSVTLSRGEDDVNVVNSILESVEDLIITESNGKYDNASYPVEFKMMALLYIIFLVGLKNDNGQEIIQPGLMNRGRATSGFEPSPYSSMFMWM